MSKDMSTYSFKTRYFKWIIQRPKRVTLVSFILVVLLGMGITKVHKESSVDAFVPQNHPASVAREQAANIFGLEDPIIVGLVAPKNESVFTPANIKILRRIEEKIRALPNVKKQNFISILNESAIRGENGDLVVEKIVPSGPISMLAAQQALERVNSMSMMRGLLASPSGDTLTLIIPVDDANHATETYSKILAIANAETTPYLTVHVTGVASMNGRLAQMITQDSRKFIPAAVFTALVIIWLALRNVRGLIGPFFIIAGSGAMTIGLMGWLGAEYYLITTALPVIIMAIAIADSLHISSIFLHKCRSQMTKTRQQNLLDALEHTALPVTLTTVTTVAGFTGLALGSSIQPIAEFGWFAAIGSFMAWLLSLTALPAIIILSQLQPSNVQSKSEFVLVDKLIKTVTQRSYSKPELTTGIATLLIIVMTYFALQAQFNYQRQSYFQTDEQVRIADITMNERLQGLNFLDVVVSAKQEGGLMTPEAMGEIAALQRKLSSQPFVAKTTSIVDYMTLMHSVLTDEPQGSLPTANNAPTQYMFLYESSGDPGDFNEEIDFNYQHALIRTQLITDRYSDIEATVSHFNGIAEEWSLETGLEAKVSGRVAVNVGWMSLLAESHFQGLGLAVLFVFLASLLVFRSVLQATLSLVPIATGVLFTYAFMGLFSIDIAPATSMTAAISTGLGVDFAIHLIWSIQQAKRQGASTKNAFFGDYLVTARACVFSALALAVALCVLCLSSAPPLQWFGALVASAAIGSLLGAIFIIPALYSLAKTEPYLVNIKGTC
ncbi:efflux RND transporter permease subunit [Paraglaciecola arctica]|uniref:efflux RND transporter permease subunit n=1 Tax=Paraglaciecola arctica TaxID=1128911 RepID=UPI001C066F10|nr:MMPL family transporter [Paraglaciecola arctica]MBU3002314.1 MMPL family transporter [Paraglaciecola arctica]